MMLVERIADLVIAIRRASGQQRLLRLTVLIGPLVTFAAACAAADHVLVPVGVVVAVLAICCALQPDTNAALIVLVVLVWDWAGAVHDHRTPWVLMAAAGLLAFHVGMAMSSIAPATVAWSPATRHRWARRVELVGALTIAAWLSTLAAHAIDLDGGALLLVIAVLLLAAAAVLVHAASLDRR